MLTTPHLNNVVLIRLGVLYCLSNTERSGADYIDWGPINTEYLDEIALALRDWSGMRKIPRPTNNVTINQLAVFYDRIGLDHDDRDRMNAIIFDERRM